MPEQTKTKPRTMHEITFRINPDNEHIHNVFINRKKSKDFELMKLAAKRKTWRLLYRDHDWSQKAKQLEATSLRGAYAEARKYVSMLRWR